MTTPTSLGMTLEEMKRIGERVEAIKAATERLRKAENNLRILKEYSGKKQKAWQETDSWKPNLVLKKGNGYDHDVTVQITIPYGVVEQQLVDAVKRARRELILMGGKP